MNPVAFDTMSLADTEMLDSSASVRKLPVTLLRSPRGSNDATDRGVPAKDRATARRVSRSFHDSLCRTIHTNALFAFVFITAVAAETAADAAVAAVEA